jgi:hypothetical protein
MTIERMEQMSNDMPGWLATLKQEDPDMFCEILQAQIRETEIALLLIRKTGLAPLITIPGWVELSEGECGVIPDRLEQHPDWSDEQIAEDILADCAARATDGK